MSAAYMGTFARGALSIAQGAAPETVGDLRVTLLGSLTNPSTIDAQFGGSYGSDAQRVAAAYDRFGPDAFGRLSGAWLAIVEEPREQRVIVARASCSDAPPLFCRSDASRAFAFATSLASLRTARSAPRWQSFDRWITQGLWRPMTAAALDDVDSLPPGWLMDAARGTYELRPFATFAPYRVPRQTDLQTARDEVRSLLERLIESAAAVKRAEGEPAALGVLKRFAPQHCHVERHFDDDSLRRVAQAAQHPLALSDAARVVAASTRPEATLTDLGFQQLMGTTVGAVEAWIRGLARAIEHRPEPRVIRTVLASGLPVDRQLTHSILIQETVRSAGRVADRWLRHLADLPDREPPSTLAAPLVDPIAGDPFTDRRFAELRDPCLAALHRALAEAHGGSLVAPFMDHQMMATVFSLSARHLIDGERWLKLFSDTAPIALEPPPSVPPFGSDHPFAIAARRRIGPQPAPEDAAARDRWLGAGAFLDVYFPSAL